MYWHDADEHRRCRYAHPCRPDAAGRNVRYRADPKGLAPLVDWMALHGVFWREHAYLMPEGARLPFRSQAPRFAFEQE